MRGPLRASETPPWVWAAVRLPLSAAWLAEPLVKGGVARAEGELNNRAWAQSQIVLRLEAGMGDTETLERKEEGIRCQLGADHPPGATEAHPCVASHVIETLLGGVRDAPLIGGKVWFQRAELGSECRAHHGTKWPSGKLSGCFLQRAGQNQRLLVWGGD